MEPTVTVYITNYNYGQYIAHAIESVLRQSLQDFELIIIDDGSTDHSRDIIESYAVQDRIQIIYQQNRGLNVSNNIALRAAKGKYIVRLDADDYFQEDALRQMSARLDNDPNLGLIFPNYFYVNAEGEVTGEQKRHDFEKDVKLLDQPAHGACTMIRTDFLRQLGGYSEAFTCQDGYELWVKFVRHFKIANINKPLFYYRRHGNNLTSSEARILSTRAKINAKYIEEGAHDTRALGIIPVRGGEGDLAYESLGGKNLLQSKIEVVSRSENIKNLVVTSPDKGIQKLLGTFETAMEVEFHLRDKSEARFNRDLNPTIYQIAQNAQTKKIDFEVLVLLALEYPFVSSEQIDDAIHTMVLFGSDSLIGVRPDNSVFYQHHGDGLHAILHRDEYTKYEREALFKQVGGITTVKKEALLESKKVLTGTIGHIVFDQRASLSLNTRFDREMAEMLMRK